MRKVTWRLLLNVFLVLCFTISCSIGLETPVELGIPRFPKALTDGDSRIATSRSDFEHYSVVPNIGHNYDSFIDIITPYLNQINSTEEGWINIPSPGPFTREYRTTLSSTQDGIEYHVPVVYRTNEDNTFFELYLFVNNEETRVLTVEQLEGYTHALLFMHNTSGDPGEFDSVEIMESASTTLTKCIQAHNGLTVSPSFSHFVAMTDRTSDGNITTGQFKSKSFSSTAPESSIDFDDLSSASTEPTAYFHDVHKRIYPEETLFENYEFPNISDFAEYMYVSGLSGSVVTENQFDYYSSDKNLDDYEASGSIEKFNALEWEDTKLLELLGLD